MSRSVHLAKKLFILLVMASTQLLAQDPPDISLVFYLEEHSPNGTLVGTVTGTDPNGDPLIFSIVSGNGAGAFSINSTTGDVLVANESQIKFDINPSFVLGVEGNDGHGGVTTVQITINLIDVPLRVYDIDEMIRLYPNPAVNVLFVEFPKTQFGEPSIEMYALNGKFIPVQVNFLSSTKRQINTSELSPGIYLLRLGVGDMFRIMKTFIN